MADSSSFKGFFGERLSFLHDRDTPLPSWSSSDVDHFIAASDHPVHASALKTAREAASYAAVGSLIGAVSTAQEFTWCWAVLAWRGSVWMDIWTGTR